MPARLIPTPSVALVDPRSGLMDQNWYDYFLKSAQDLQQLQATVTALQATVTALTPQLAKAWASITTSGGVPTLQQGFNIASVASAGFTGQYDIALTTPFASVNWVAEVTPLRQSAVFDAGVDLFGGARVITASTVRIYITNDAGVRTDPPAFYFAAFGNQ